MRKPNSSPEFINHRIREILAAFARLKKQFPSLSPSQIYALVADSPSPRFWISEERAAIVIAKIEKSGRIPASSKSKMDLYRELFRQYSLLRSRFPKVPISKLAAVIVESPAPSFFLSPRSVGEYIYRAKNPRH